jgi:phenylacetic acid degradation operon negative regulatory protein
MGTPRGKRFRPAPPVGENEPVRSDERPLPAPSARSLLLTVLGELVYPEDKPVRTGALLQALRGMGVEDHAARQAIARSSASGWIAGSKHGRTAWWTLTPTGQGLVEDGHRRSAALLREPDPWDDRWLVLLVTLTNEQRSMRRKLYGGLSWLGMGNPSPGVWVTPHASTADGLQLLVGELGLTRSAYAFVGETRGIGLTDDDVVKQAWDLSILEERYDSLIQRFSGLRPRTPGEHLFAHLELLNDLQRFIRLDPRLPKELLPEWRGREAAALICELRDRWSPLAREGWREITAPGAPAAGG